MSDNMDISKFDRKFQRKLFRVARQGGYNDTEKTQELLTEVNAVLETDITEAQLSTSLKKLQLFVDAVKELFDPQDGIIANFTFDGKFPYEMSLSKGTLNLAPQFVKIANDARIVKPSLKATENKQNLKDAYEDAKAYKPDTNISAEIPEDALKALEEVFKLLDVERSDEFTAKKPTDFKSLTALKSSLTELSAIPTESRKEYYLYWFSKDRLFKRLTNVIKDIEAELLGGKLIDERSLEAIDEEALNIMSAVTKDNILPSYVLEFSPIISREYSPKVKSIMLLKDFLNMVGREVPQKYKNLLPNEEITSQMGLAYDYNPETGQIEISTDASLDDDLEEALEALDKLKEDSKIDPLFSILIKNKTIPYAIDKTILDNTKTLIKEELDLSGLNEFQEDIQELLDNEIDKFINAYEESFSVDDTSFFMPMMDSSTVVSHFNKFKDLTINVAFYKGGIVKEKTFTKYSEAVKFVNDNTEKFFKDLNRLLEIDNRSSATLEKPKGIGREGTPVYFRGGESIPRPTKSPEASKDKVEMYKKLLDIVIDYYIDPLSSSNILLEDTPEFFTGKYFRDLPIILTKNPITLAEKAMLEGVEPIADKNDYNKISELLRTLENPDDVVFNDRLVNLFEDALDSYVKFWTLVAVKTDRDEFSLEEILSDAKIVLGDALYEIAKQTESQEALDREMFRDAPLSFWNEQQQKKNVTLKGLLPLLGQKEWKTYVINQNNRERGTKAAYDRLLKLLKESDLKLASELTTAMLEATDILRKMEGLQIYSSRKDITDIDDLEYVINRIRKEHNIDLYGVDIYNIVKSQSSFNDIGNTFGLSSEIIYKIKGMFR